jgi:hypothetical protein
MVQITYPCIDDEVSIDPESVIVTVSLGQEREIRFVNANGDEKLLNVKDGSAYVMSRFSQDFWTHGIAPLEQLPSESVPLTEREADNDERTEPSAESTLQTEDIVRTEPIPVTESGTNSERERVR